MTGAAADPRFNRHILKYVSHRPWPMPDAPWVMTQTWHDLLFAHWPADPGSLRTKVPSHFELDVFEGEAWLGIIPFYMTNVAPRGVPSLPWLSAFPELNVRTYVRAGDRPGIYFFSLDAGSTLAVQTARMLLNLPYYPASMAVTPRADTIAYDSRRDNSPVEATLSVTYRPVDTPFQPARGTLEYFLTERYCLYNVNRHGAPYRLDIHHPPWPLQRADAEFTRNTMADAAGVAISSTGPQLHFSRRQDMVAWAPSSL